MRNIVEFPVTKEEILDYLAQKEKDLFPDSTWESMAIGSIDGVILFELRALVENHYGKQTILRSSHNN